MFPFDPMATHDSGRNRPVRRPFPVRDLDDPNAAEADHPDPLGAALTRALLRFEDTVNTWRERWSVASTARERRRAEEVMRTRFEV